MIVLSWIVLIVSGFFAIVHLLNVLSNDNGKKRLASSLDLIFFVITFITAFWDLFN